VLKRFVSLFIFLIASNSRADAGVQHAIAPAPASAQAPAYRCRVRDESRHIYAARDLDVHGQFLSESIEWGAVGSSRPALVIRWHPEYGHQSFEKGVVGFTFHDRLQLVNPLRLSLNAPEDKALTAVFDAGAGIPQSQSKASKTAEAYIQAAAVAAISPTATSLHWRLERLDHYRGNPVELYKEGDLDLTFLKAVKTEFPALIQRLDAMQARYLRDCARL
jgi:hypothetical protein